MPTYILRGVEVDFPHEAYPCQLDYMTSVIEALQTRKNALLESPTGTGKTLCLLCATLAWRASAGAALAAEAAAARGAAAAAQLGEGYLAAGLRADMAELRAERAAAGGGAASGLPTIVYSSRTHSQLAQVMKELRATAYRPAAAVLGSRAQSCVNPRVKGLPADALNAACRALVARRGCKWHSRVETYGRANPVAAGEVRDIEEMGRVGAAREVCPYYLSRDMAAGADIVFVPYNYLVDARARGGLGVRWDGAVLVFDEAHNVEAVCADAASFDLPAAALAGAVEEAGAAAELATARAEAAPVAHVAVVDGAGAPSEGQRLLRLAADLRALQGVLRALEREVAALAAAGGERGHTAPGGRLLELLARLNLTPASWPTMSAALDAAGELLAADAVEAGRGAGAARAAGGRLSALGDALGLALATAGGAPPRHAGYRMHVRLERGRRGAPAAPTLSYWCFSPGQAMAALAELRVRSVLLTSGTLAPLAPFAAELGLPFDVRLENPHVVAASQVWVGVVPRGPAGRPLNSSYESRSDRAYIDDLGNALVNWARIVPDGLLVFFPSYAAMEAAVDAWRAPPRGGGGGPPVWARIAAHKAPVVEPRDAAAFPAAAAEFRARLDDAAYRGAVFLGVCRGKASEGLDFTDRAGRAVVITGIPYAGKADPKVRIKREVLDDAARAARKRPLFSGGGGAAGGGAAGGVGAGGARGAAQDPEPERLTGEQWYVQQAVRAVNQAMGRAIRHRADYGAVILADERFRAEGVRRQLSGWLRAGAVAYDDYGAAAASLTRFFRGQAAAAAARDGEARAAAAAAAAEAAARAEAGGGAPAWGGGGAPAVRPPPLVGLVPASVDLAGVVGAVAGGGGAAGVGVGGSSYAGGDELQFADLAALQAVGAAAAAVRPPPAAKPWERLGGGAPPRPPPRGGGALAAAAGAAAAPPPVTVVGPAHLVQQHLQRQQAAAKGEAGAPAGAAPAALEAAAAAEPAAAATEPAAAAAAPAPAPPPPSAVAAEKARRTAAYMASLRAQLPADAFAGVEGALRAYSARRIGAPQLVARVVELLAPPGPRALLEGFRAFVPAAARPEFDTRVAALPGGGGGGAAPLAPLSRRPVAPPPPGAAAPPPPGGAAASRQLAAARRAAGAQPAPGVVTLRARQPPPAQMQQAPAAARAAAPAEEAPPPAAPLPPTPPCALCGRAPMQAPHAPRCCAAAPCACYACLLSEVALRRPCPGCGRPLRKGDLAKKHFM